MFRIPCNTLLCEVDNNTLRCNIHILALVIDFAVGKHVCLFKKSIVKNVLCDELCTYYPDPKGHPLQSHLFQHLLNKIVKNIMGYTHHYKEHHNINSKTTGNNTLPRLSSSLIPVLRMYTLEYVHYECIHVYISTP